MEESTVFCYNLSMENYCLNYSPSYMDNYTARQLVLPLDVAISIDKNDPVVTFHEVIEEVNLSKYFKRGSNLGRIGYDRFMLLKIILFAFMENIRSLRDIEKACRTDIRFMWLAQEERPTHMTLANFMNNCLSDTIENIFIDINKYLIEKNSIDTSKLYIDGTKIEAYANKYTFVWKRATYTFRDKLYKKIRKSIPVLNQFLNDNGYSSRYNIENDYSLETLYEIKELLIKHLIDNGIVEVKGKGKRRDISQKLRDEFISHYNNLSKYAEIIKTCGENRNSYSKTDKDATFMHLKEDYMRNGQLKPAYNLQLGVSNGYIMSLGVFQERDDSRTLIPFLLNFKNQYGYYPLYPVADAGYGSLANYRFLELNGMELYLKYSMYSKEKKSNGNFIDKFIKIDDKTLICPNNKKLNLLYEKKNRKVKELKDQIYGCEDCSDCIFSKTCKKSVKNKDLNRVVRINFEWKRYRLKVLNNLTSDIGNELKKNRSSQVEGAFGVIKEDMQYKRLHRRTMKKVKFEFYLIAIAFNLRKYHNQKQPTEPLMN